MSSTGFLSNDLIVTLMMFVPPILVTTLALFHARRTLPPSPTSNTIQVSLVINIISSILDIIYSVLYLITTKSNLYVYFLHNVTLCMVFCVYMYGQTEYLYAVLPCKETRSRLFITIMRGLVTVSTIVFITCHIYRVSYCYKATGAWFYDIIKTISPTMLFMGTFVDLIGMTSIVFIVLLRVQILSRILQVQLGIAVMVTVIVFMMGLGLMYMKTRNIGIMASRDVLHLVYVPLSYGCITTIHQVLAENKKMKYMKNVDGNRGMDGVSERSERGTQEMEVGGRDDIEQQMTQMETNDVIESTQDITLETQSSS